MTIRLGVWKSVLASVFIVGGSAGLTLGALTALGVTFGGGGEAEEVPETQDIATATAAPYPDWDFVDSTLWVSNRDRLAVCVEAVNVDVGLELIAEATAEQALPALEQHPAWATTDYPGLPSPIVDHGCPAGPALYSGDPLPADASNIRTLFDVHARTVTTPSYYSLHVYILPPEEIQRVAGDGYRFTEEETVCKGDNCLPVTEDLYITAEEAGNPAAFGQLLAKAILG